MSSLKKILIVGRSFYPINSPRSLRTTELVKEFARQGHEVKLITIKNDKFHIPFSKEHGVTIKDLGPMRLPEISFDRSNRISYFIKRVIKRGMNLFFEYPDIELLFKVKKALKKESGYDLLISIATPHPVHWGVAKARKRNHPIAKIWAADCGDPYFGRENDSFNVPFYFSFVEKWFCRKADFITVPFKGAKSAYFDEFHSKIRVVPQGLSFPQRKKTCDTSKNEVITFAYFGNIESYLHYAIPFLKKLNKIDQPFRFIVYTRRKDLFEKNLTKETLKKCSIRDYVERKILLNELSCVDFMVHFPYQKHTQKSLKLVDYYYLNKPILEFQNDGRSKKILEEFMRYEFINRRKFENYGIYEIDKVCKQFLKLVGN